MASRDHGVPATSIARYPRQRITRLKLRSPAGKSKRSATHSQELAESDTRFLSKPIAVVDYDSRSPDVSARERQRILQLVGDFIIDRKRLGPAVRDSDNWSPTLYATPGPTEPAHPDHPHCCLQRSPACAERAPQLTANLRVQPPRRHAALQSTSAPEPNSVRGSTGPAEPWTPGGVGGI
jgi:hypothetical protein